ncbi:alpha/beta fold hydrolase [Caenimonas sedimenti]|uniref:Alpha/beta fold hydrolase n=1 Tax=Caenimonas sedimenti TaxID=2596921 RepID=A0A562ZF87_9BURK|nr:alpha/beta fold hydrolase [Caenimonas sedimenti]TWO66023.1 alpha/beta fold hydrolase [Caenimonas sedimenti]
MTRLLLAALLAMSLCSAGAQTAWPDYISTLRPDVSDSPVNAALPPDVNVVPPGSDMPPGRARWSGLWQGWACAGQACDVKAAVERLRSDGATVAYAGASASSTNVHRGEATFVDNELHLVLHTGNTLVLRLRVDGDMEMSIWQPDKRLLSGGVLTQRPLVRQHRRSVERLATPWVEDGRPVSLAMVIYRPMQGTGPWPTLVVHHGSTGNGDRKELFAGVYTSLDVARHFTAEGWQVIFPQRRGRGGSDGLYDEGFPPNRAAYSCDPQYSLPGAERALADVHHVMQHVAARPDVDPKKVLISGVSRGGILASAYAGQHPAAVRGVINFVGGWVGDRCQNAEHINGTLFRAAAAYPRPILWLYGDRDPFYSLRHSRGNFEAFRAAGGQGRFVTYDFAAGQNGHFVSSRPDFWRGDVDAYVSAVIAQ